MDQKELELKHANFQQMMLLEEHFNKEIQCEDEKLKKLGVKITSFVTLHRRLPLDALCNLLLHEDLDLLLNVTEELIKTNWIHWDEGREQLVTSKIPTALEEKVFKERYLCPFIDKPRVLHGFEDSAYYTQNKSTPMLGEYNGQYVCLDTLNLLNQTPLKLNQKVMDLYDPYGDDHKFRRDSKQVLEILGENPFWLEWKYDFRGRVYCRGYHANVQGSDWWRHSIKLAD